MERPIIFSSESVRAILEEKKTQTRRIHGLEDVNKYPDLWTFVKTGILEYKTKRSAKGKFGAYFTSELIEPKTISICPQVCPFGQPSSVLSSRPKSAGWYDVRWEPSDEWTRIWLFDGGECWGYSPNDDPESVFLDIADPEKILWKTPNDQLWVRESFNWSSVADLSPNEPHKKCAERSIYSSQNVVWKADNQELNPKHPEWGNTIWKPSIHMPRWASRITLEIVSVRVERLQDITFSDMLAEGVDDGFFGWDGMSKSDATKLCEHIMKQRFAKLWNSINGKKYPWELNPFCWVIEFRKIN